MAEAVGGWVRGLGCESVTAGREPLPSAGQTAHLLLMASENSFIWAAGSSLHSWFFSVLAEDPSTFWCKPAKIYDAELQE